MLTDAYIIPVSGGADSTALAIYLHEQFPHAPFRLVFTDTGAEEPEIAPSLRRLQAYLGKQIDWLGQDKTLFDLIDQYNGFLPSSGDRWCTRLLKLEPFKKWMRQFEGRTAYVFVGIRADESFRVAFTMDGDCHTEMPFMEMGIGREDVFRKLAQTIGIPKFYSRRSRSGCSVCPFQRRQELVGLYQERPVEFAKGARYEKLSASDQGRHLPAPALSQDSGVAGNWMSIPVPALGAELSGRLGSKQSTMFDDVGVFVAAELFTDAMPGYAPFIWKQRVISYSSTLGGIKRQVQTRFEHLLATAEANDMTPWDVRNQVKFPIFYIEAPAEVFDPQGTGPGSYTWHGGSSYNQVAHVTGWATRVLHAHHMAQEAQRLQTARETSLAYENAAVSDAALKKVRHELGRVVAQGWATPHEPDPDEPDLDEKHIPCAMCSL